MMSLKIKYLKYRRNDNGKKGDSCFFFLKSKFHTKIKDFLIL